MESCLRNTNTLTNTLFCSESLEITEEELTDYEKIIEKFNKDKITKLKINIDRCCKKLQFPEPLSNVKYINIATKISRTDSIELEKIICLNDLTKQTDLEYVSVKVPCYIDVDIAEIYYRYLIDIRGKTIEVLKLRGRLDMYEILCDTDSKVKTLIMKDSYLLDTIGSKLNVEKIIFTSSIFNKKTNDFIYVKDMILNNQNLSVRINRYTREWEFNEEFLHHMFHCVSIHQINETFSRCNFVNLKTIIIDCLVKKYRYIKLDTVDFKSIIIDMHVTRFIEEFCECQNEEDKYQELKDKKFCFGIKTKNGTFIDYKKGSNKKIN